MKSLYAIATFCFIAAASVTLPAYALLAPSSLGRLTNMATGQGNNQGNNQGALPVNWQQSSIGWGQLQNIIQQNPNFSLYTIHFPNGSSWTVSPANLQSFYNQYVSQAQSAGFGSNPPALNFSSLATKSSFGKNSVTVPINNAMGSMQQEVQQTLDQINYEKYHLADSLPDWLKKTISLICIGFGTLWDFAVDQVKKWL